MAGTGIGSFNDRIRDAVRGGNPFGGQQERGFATGLYTDPNETQGSAVLNWLLYYNSVTRFVSVWPVIWPIMRLSECDRRPGDGQRDRLQRFAHRLQPIRRTHQPRFGTRQ